MSLVNRDITYFLSKKDITYLIQGWVLNLRHPTFKCLKVCQHVVTRLPDKKK